MHATFWAVATLLVLPGVQALSLDGEAGSPSQARGHLDVAGAEWILLVFNADTTATIHVEAGGVDRLTNHTTLWSRFYDAGISGGYNEPVSDEDIDWSGPLAVNLTLGAGRWSSLLVSGQDLHVALDGWAEVLATSAGTEPLSDAYNVVRGTYRPFDIKPKTLLLRASPEQTGTPMPFLLQMSGVTRLEWHNATVECHAGFRCPDGAGAFELQTPVVRLLRMAYMEALVPDGLVQGTGTIYAIAAGGPSLAFGLDGTLRLPEVSLSSCTPPPCPAMEDQTLTLQGLANSRLEPADGRRLRFTMDATPAAAFSDEAPIPSFVRSAAPVVATALGIAVLAKLLAVLATKPTGDPLANPRRRLIYDTILANPGISFRELMRQTDLANGTTLLHLSNLSRAGLVMDRSRDGRRRFFENHGRYDKTWQVVAALRDDATRRLLSWLTEHPNVTQGDTLKFTSGLGWSRTATQERLNRLVAHGFVEANRDGRRIRYAPHPTRIPTLG